MDYPGFSGKLQVGHIQHFTVAFTALAKLNRVHIVSQRLENDIAYLGCYLEIVPCLDFDIQYFVWIYLRLWIQKN